MLGGKGGGGGEEDAGPCQREGRRGKGGKGREKEGCSSLLEEKHNTYVGNH